MNIFKRTLTLLSICALLVGHSAAYAYSLQDIPSYTVRYSVEYKGNPLGELEIAIEKTDKLVTVRGETFPNAIANLIGDGKVIETIEYVERDDTLLLTRITEKMGQDNPSTKEVNVDHKNMVLTTSKDQISLSKDDQIDAYTFPLLSILGFTDSSKGQEEKLVSTKKVRSYQYHTSRNETIRTSAGKFKTIKTSKTSMDNKKTIALWLTESDPKMPVQIRIDKKGELQVNIKLIKIVE